MCVYVQTKRTLGVRGLDFIFATSDKKQEMDRSIANFHYAVIVYENTRNLFTLNFQLCRHLSGGIIVIVTRIDYLDTCPEYKGRLEPLMEKLEKEGKWKKLKRDVGARFYLDKEAVCYKYEVLAKSS